MLLAGGVRRETRCILATVHALVLLAHSASIHSYSADHGCVEWPLWSPEEGGVIEETTMPLVCAHHKWTTWVSGM